MKNEKMILEIGQEVLVSIDNGDIEMTGYFQGFGIMKNGSTGAIVLFSHADEEKSIGIYFLNDILNF